MSTATTWSCSSATTGSSSGPPTATATTSWRCCATSPTPSKTAPLLAVQRPPRRSRTPRPRAGRTRVGRRRDTPEIVLTDAGRAFVEEFHLAELPEGRANYWTLHHASPTELATAELTRR